MTSQAPGGKHTGYRNVEGLCGRHNIDERLGGSVRNGGRGLTGRGSGVGAARGIDAAMGLLDTIHGVPLSVWGGVGNIFVALKGDTLLDHVLKDYTTKGLRLHQRAW